MKKILMVALAAAAMVGCSQNEEIDNAGQKAEIRVGTVVKTGTKAVITDNTNFETFTVNGYKTASAMSELTQLATGFIDNETLLKSNSWAFSKTYYWPSTGVVQFFATSPSQNLNITKAGYPTFEYTVKPVATQEDLVAAYVKDQGKSEQVITLPFAHLLTQVNFSIKGDTKDFTYTVSELVVKGAMDKATFTFGNTDTGSWGTPSASAADVEYAYTGSVVVAPTTADAEATTKFESDKNALFMLMPQTLTNVVSLDITYKAAPTDSPTAYTYEGTKNVKLTGTWAMGQNVRYTLKLTSDATAVTLGAEVDGWATETPGTTE